MWGRRPRLAREEPWQSHARPAVRPRRARQTSCRGAGREQGLGSSRPWPPARTHGQAASVSFGGCPRRRALCQQSSTSQSTGSSRRKRSGRRAAGQQRQASEATLAQRCKLGPAPGNLVGSGGLCASRFRISADGDADAAASVRSSPCQCRGARGHHRGSSVFGDRCWSGRQQDARRPGREVDPLPRHRLHPRGATGTSSPSCCTSAAFFRRLAATLRPRRPSPLRLASGRSWTISLCRRA